MYEYEPKHPKLREHRLFFLLLAAACVLFGCSCLPFVAFRVIWQLLSVVLFVGVMTLASRCMLRRYVYRVAPREDADCDKPADLTVTEYYGNRVSVVCRISVSDIEELTELRAENRKVITHMLRGKRVYQYHAYIWSDEMVLLRVRDGEEEFFVRILADNELKKWLKYGRK